MKIKVILCATLLTLIPFIGFAGYTSSQSPSPGGYSSSITQGNTGYSSSQQQTYQYQQNASYSPHFSASYHTTVYSNGSHHHRFYGPQWINMNQGDPIPVDAIIGGAENGNLLYVCRATYQGGQHPGKLLPAGICNITYGGRELSTTLYQVLVSHSPLQWVAGSYGYIPGHAMVGGNEEGRILYICQADYHGGRHAGKIVGQNCNIGYAGREISIPYYNVLAK